MDLSEVPHDQWDYAVGKLIMLNSVEEEGLNNSIFGDELLEVGPLQSLPPLQTDGYYMDVANESIMSLILGYFPEFSDSTGLHEFGIPGIPSTCGLDGYYMDVADESIMPLTLGYCPEFSDSTGLQEFGNPGIPPTCGLDSTSLGIPQREESFGDNILRRATSNPDYGTLGVSQFGDSPPTVSLDPYPESLNEWLMSFTPPGIPEPVCGQNDMSLWASPSHECSSDLHLALMDGYYAGDMEPDLSCTKEEEGSVQWSRKNKRKHQSGTREKRDCVQRRRKRASQTGEDVELVQRRGKKSSRSENGEQHGVVRRMRKRAFQFVTDDERESRRSERVCRAPRRYIDEWCKPKEKGKKKARRAVMTASKGFGSGASSSFPGSSTTGNQGHGEDASKSTSFMSIIPLEGNLLLAGTQESIVPWWDPENLLLNPGHWWQGPEVDKPYMHG